MTDARKQALEALKLVEKFSPNLEKQLFLDIRSGLSPSPDEVVMRRGDLKEVISDLEEVPCEESCGHRFSCYRCSALSILEAALERKG